MTEARRQPAFPGADIRVKSPPFTGRRDEEFQARLVLTIGEP